MTKIFRSKLISQSSSFYVRTAAWLAANTMNYVSVSLWSLAKGIFTVHGNEGSWNAIYFEGPPELIEYII